MGFLKETERQAQCETGEKAQGQPETVLLCLTEGIYACQAGQAQGPEDGSRQANETAGGAPELMRLRRELDELDAALIALLERRFALCAQVAETKRLSGRPVLDAERERRKLESVAAQSREGTRGVMQSVFQALMAASRAYQSRLLGREGEV